MELPFNVIIGSFISFSDTSLLITVLLLDESLTEYIISFLLLVTSTLSVISPS